MLITVEVLVGDDPAVLGRLVRVVSTQPFALTMLHFWHTPGSESRRILMDVESDGRGELLGKRLNRIVSVQRVRLLAQHEDPTPQRKKSNDSRRHPA